MRICNVDSAEAEIITNWKLVEINFDLKNRTELKIPVHKEFGVHAEYRYSVESASIYGNRSIVKDEKILLDCPIEWKQSQINSYVNTVKSVHSQEFKFIDDFDINSGECTLHKRREYMHIDKPVVHAGSVEAWNFGLFVGVVMYKIFIATKNLPKMPILVPIVHKWQEKLLDLFFPDTQFIFYDPAQAISCKKIHAIGWPGFGFYLEESFVKYMRSRLKPEKFGDYQKIYFTRRRFEQESKTARFGIGARGEAILEDNGYYCVAPETLDYRMLANILHGCEILVMESGSALFNGIFANSKTKMVLLENREGFLYNHIRFLSSVSETPTVIFYDQNSVSEAISDVLEVR